MLGKIRTRFASLDSLEALLSGDVLFYKDGNDDDDDGTSGGSGTGSSQGDGDDDDDDEDDTSGGGSGGSSDDDGDDVQAQLAKARATARKATKEAKNLRDRLKRLEESQRGPGSADDDKGKDADADRVKLEQRAREAEEKAARLEAKERKRERRAMVAEQATKLKFADSDVIIAMVESGRVDGIDEDDLDDLDRRDLRDALKALAKSKPHLLRSESDDEGDGGRNGTRTGTNPQKRDRSGEAIDKLPVGQRAHARLMNAFSGSKTK